MSTADVVRSMKIKTNTLKRLQKEFSYYLGEKDKEQTRVDRMRAEGADPHDLKQAVRRRAAPRRLARPRPCVPAPTPRALPCAPSARARRPSCCAPPAPGRRRTSSPSRR
jgi:hypothetical protein